MKFVLLMSGGIDSPTAGHTLLSQGAQGMAIHMDNQPLVKGLDIEKGKRLVAQLSKVNDTMFPLISIPHGPFQQEAHDNCPAYLQCVLCKRQMMRMASMVVKEQGYDVIVTGDSLGQVASQTLENIRTEENAASVPILRPLIGWDKQQIVDLAKEIGTFDISASEAEPCPMVPEKPALRATIKDVEEAEANLDLDRIMKEAYEGIEILWGELDGWGREEA